MGVDGTPVTSKSPRCRAAAGRPGPRWSRDPRATLPTTHSLVDLAREAGVHRGHLARAFQRRFGCTVGCYLRERRLELAHEIVTCSDEPLPAVALACGFADQSHLGRAFKRRFGVTPGSLRGSG